LRGNLAAQEISTAAWVAHRSTVRRIEKQKGGETPPALFLMLSGIVQFPMSITLTAWRP
jgi:hypothetical protein